MATKNTQTNDVTVVTPGFLKLENNTGKSIQFVPYKENFATTIYDGNSLVLSYETVGQYFYYMKQGALGLTVTVVDGKEDETDTVKVIKVPCAMTLTNTSTTKSASFIPYRENFWVEIPAGATYTFKANTVGQCIYYSNQATDTLVIEDEKEKSQS